MAKLATAVLLTLFGAQMSRAQVSGETAPPPAASAPAPVPAGSLVDRQEAIRDRLNRLEGNMLQLTKLLAETEPDKSQRLREALDRTGQSRVKRRLDQIVELLSRARYSDADQEQAKVIADLETILKGLTDSLSDLDRKREERERLEAVKRELRSLEQEQIDQLQRTEALRRDRRLADALRKQAEELDRLAEKQAELRRTHAERGGDPDQAAEQRKLEEQVRAAARSLEDMRAQGRDEGAKRATADAEQDASAAAQAMKDAADRMGENQPAPAQEAQKLAEERLRRAVQRLREESDALADDGKLREIERLQRQTEQRTGELGRQMKPQDGRDATPGQRQVDNAQQQMRQAADKLGENQPDGAAPPQQGAVEQLQRAQNEIDDALRQVRREEMEETLAALSARFKAMLARQEQIRTDVVAIDAKQANALSRADLLLLTDTAATQRKLAEEAAATQALLRNEGTTVIVPQLVGQLAVDMTAAAGRLDSGETGAATQAAIDGILDLLRELVGAVEEKREQLQQEREQGEQGNNSDRGEPLLPGSAELKLLRASQVRLNQQTAALAEKPDLDPAHCRLLAQRQQALADLARQMNERK